MRENRLSGSEGGARSIPCPYPYRVLANPFRQRVQEMRAHRDRWPVSVTDFSLASGDVRCHALGMMHPLVEAARESAAILACAGRVRRSADTPLRRIITLLSLVQGFAALTCFAAEPATAPATGGAAWQLLLNGTDLTGWQPISFGGEGEVECREGVVILPQGQPFTGVRFTNDFPTLDYELSLEARRVSGFDFFCGLTVPVGTNHCSLIVGGWGGGLVGISSLDGMDASQNETTSIRAFERDRWYRIRLRVAGDRIEAWIDDERVVNVRTAGCTIGLRRGAIEDCRPLGICSYSTHAEIRDIKWRRAGPAGVRSGD